MYSSAQLLLEGGHDLAPIVAEFGVEALRVPVVAAPRWVRQLWIGDVAAMTLPVAILVRPDVLAWPSSRRSQLLVHELVHVCQWVRFGSIGFLVRYLGEYVRGRRHASHAAAYAAISFEVEARRVADRLS